MKIALVDDEILARQRLRALLAELGSDYAVVGEASNGLELLRNLTVWAPDVVLLDIRMPVMDGLEAARHLAQLQAPPALIFTTAYDTHALQAFEVHAMDYLLKPVRLERLAAALAKVPQLNRAQLAQLGTQLAQPARTHVCAQLRGNLQLVPLGDVLYFRADQKYTTVRHKGGEVLIDETLKDLEQEFGARFLRIHRNTLVARAHIAGLEKTAAGEMALRMAHSHELLEVSRRHVPEVRQQLRFSHLGGA
jgi:two-component system response regulator AlgR